MAAFNLRRIDLNLLTVFEVVYEERNQRKAAERLFMTQPAVSAAISRLRDIVQDPLFFATSRGLVPTSKAEELYQTLHAVLGAIRAQLGANEAFAPENCQRVFKLAVEYGSGAALALPLFKRLRGLAPNAKLQIQMVPDAASRLEMLKNGELDVLVSQYRTLDPIIKSEPLNVHQGVLIVRKEHPRISGVPDMEAIAGEDFVMVYGQPMFYENSELDAFVACIRDRVILEVPSAAVIPLIVKQSDLLSIISRQILDALDSSEGLGIFDLPMMHARGTAYIHWLLEADPVSAWFKELVLDELRSFANDAAFPEGTDSRSEALPPSQVPK